jgi:thiamine biosynthesis lipoprotein
MAVKPIKKYTHTFLCMTTPCEVQIYSPSAQMANRLAKRIEKNSKRLEKKYNFFSPDSFLSQLNNRPATEKAVEIEIDTETHSVLSQVRRLSEQTQGLFDISTGTLKHCSQRPSIEEIESCRVDLQYYMGPESWQLLDKKIRFNNDKVKLDLGGVIKEVAVDQAGKLAKEAKLSALINFGGDIYVNGNKPNGDAFSVAIKNPKDTQQAIAVVKLSNQGLTTSAHYERSTQVEGKSYSHIIDARGILPNDTTADTEFTVLSATAISGSVLTSGLLTTALMIDHRLEPLADTHIVLVDDQLRVRHNVGQ